MGFSSMVNMTNQSTNIIGFDKAIKVNENAVLFGIRCHKFDENIKGLIMVFH